MSACRRRRASPTRSSSAWSSLRAARRSACSPPRSSGVGGVVTALDVSASGHDRLQIDVTCAASDTGHAERVVDALRQLEGVAVHKVSDRTFLMHLGGTIEMASKHPIRNRDDLSLIYTPGVARVCEAIAANPEDARRLTVKRNSVAVVTDGSAVLGLGQHRPRRGAAGDGGQGRAVQAVRRHRRLAALPRHPGHRRDRRDRPRDLPGLRRHQPRGHLRPPLLRDRGPAARAPRHPGLPRRPARHRDRGARRAAQRAAGGRQGARDGPDRALRRGRRGYGDPAGCSWRPAPPTSWSPTSRASCTRAGRTSTTRCAGSPRRPTPAGSPAT